MKFIHKAVGAVFGASLVVLAVAAVTRLAADVIAPAIPLAITLATLILVYAVIFRRR